MVEEMISKGRSDERCKFDGSAPPVARRMVMVYGMSDKVGKPVQPLDRTVSRPPAPGHRREVKP